MEKRRTPPTKSLAPDAAEKAFAERLALGVRPGEREGRPRDRRLTPEEAEARAREKLRALTAWRDGVHARREPER